VNKRFILIWGLAQRNDFSLREKSRKSESPQRKGIVSVGLVAVVPIPVIVSPAHRGVSREAQVLNRGPNIF